MEWPTDILAVPGTDISETVFPSVRVHMDSTASVSPQHPSENPKEKSDGAFHRDWSILPYSTHTTLFLHPRNGLDPCKLVNTQMDVSAFSSEVAGQGNHVLAPAGNSFTLLAATQPQLIRFF